MSPLHGCIKRVQTAAKCLSVRPPITRMHAHRALCVVCLRSRVSAG